MAQLSLRVSKKSSFLKTRHNLEIEAEITGASDLPVAAFLEQLCSAAPNVLPEIDLQSDGAVLEDLRGRPPENFTSRDRPPDEEIFFTDGVLFDLDETEEATTFNELIPLVPFTLKIGSRFESFRGSSHIVHKVVRSGTPILDELRPATSLRLLSRLFPARLDRVRLGLENYTPKSGGSFFGTVPTVNDRLYLDLDRQRLSLRASCEYRGKETRLPFAERGLIALLDRALSASGILPDFGTQLMAKL